MQMATTAANARQTLFFRTYPGESQTRAAAGIVSDSLIAVVAKRTDLCPCLFPQARIGRIDCDGSPFFQEQGRHIIQSTPLYLCQRTLVELLLWLIARLDMFVAVSFVADSPLVATCCTRAVSLWWSTSAPAISASLSSGFLPVTRRLLTLPSCPVTRWLLHSSCSGGGGR